MAAGERGGHGAGMAAAAPRTAASWALDAILAVELVLMMLILG